MLVAVNQNGQLINLLDTSADRQENYFCPACGGGVRLKQGRVMRAHFAHVSLQDCQFYYENESAEHLNLKAALYRSLTTHGYQVEVERPLPAIGQVADLLVNEKIALEVQCSRLSQERLRERTRAYQQAGYQVIWLLGKKLWLGRRLSVLQRDLLYFSQNMGFHLWELDVDREEIRLQYLLHQHTLGQVVGLTKVFPLSADLLAVLRQPYVQQPVSKLEVKQNSNLIQAIQRQLCQKNPYWLKRQAEAYEQGDNLLARDLAAFHPQWRPLEGEDFAQIRGELASYRQDFLTYYEKEGMKTVQTLFSPGFYGIMKGQEKIERTGDKSCQKTVNT